MEGKMKYQIFNKSTGIYHIGFNDKKQAESQLALMNDRAGFNAFEIKEAA